MYFSGHCLRKWLYVFQDVEFVGKSITDWDRYAAEEYDILVADEGVSESTEMSVLVVCFCISLFIVIIMCFVLIMTMCIC